MPNPDEAPSHESDVDDVGQPPAPEAPWQHFFSAAVPPVGAATWRLICTDIANGGGTATVTLRSGTQLRGRVNSTFLDNPSTLHLRTTLGWHAIDWTEIAAISGEPC